MKVFAAVEVAATLVATKGSAMNEERTLFAGTSSPVVNLGTFLLCGIVVASAIPAAFLAGPPFNMLLGVAAAVAAGYAAVQWLSIQFRLYEVTTERVRLTVGILTRRSEEMELYRVKDITLVEPLVLRIFGCGHIVMTTNDATTPRLELKCVPRARALREELRGSVEACRDRKRVRLAELE